MKKLLAILLPTLLLTTTGLLASDGEKYFAKADKNKDGKVTAEEFAALIPDQEKAAKRFIRIDTNKDGVATVEEFIVFYDKVPATPAASPAAAK